MCTVAKYIHIVPLLCWIFTIAFTCLFVCLFVCVAIIIIFGRWILFYLLFSSFFLSFFCSFVGLKISHNSTTNENQCNSFKVLLYCCVGIIVVFHWSFFILFFFLFDLKWTIHTSRNSSFRSKFMNCVLDKRAFVETIQTNTLYNCYNTIEACDIFPITMLQLQKNRKEKKNQEQIQTKWEKIDKWTDYVKDFSLSQFEKCCRKKALFIVFHLLTTVFFFALCWILIRFSHAVHSLSISLCTPPFIRLFYFWWLSYWFHSFILSSSTSRWILSFLFWMHWNTAPSLFLLCFSFCFRTF